MMWFKHLHRVWMILRISALYRLDSFFPSKTFQFLAKSLRFILSPWSVPVKTSPGKRMRLAFEELGPIFVKLGQALSTRPDLMPEEIAEELSKLQDQVPAFAVSEIHARLSAHWGQDWRQKLKSFDDEPLAAASIAQVHRAVLLDDSEVVFKVLRPGIRRKVERDLALMRFLAGWLVRIQPKWKRFKPEQVVNEFAIALSTELDLRYEAAHASQLKRNFENNDHLVVPKVYWDWVRDDVLMLEYIKGVPIADVKTLKSYDVDMKKLAEIGVEIFFTQVFKHLFFHADMHPGNIFVDVSNPQKPKYIALDFGIMGTLSDADQRYLAENFIAFFERDYREVARLHIASGWIPANTRMDVFESAIRMLSEPIFEKPLKDISFGLFLVGLFQTARQFDMEVQPQLVLLQKTLLNIEGLGRRLYPDLNLWDTAKPFLEKWLKERRHPKRFLQLMKRRIPQWLDSIADQTSQAAK